MPEPIVKNTNRGWFITKQREGGDRTIAQQMEGLDRLVASCVGKSVLDIGCAEGLISLKLIDAGAIAAHGIEVRGDHVEIANKVRKSRPATFETADANEWVPRRNYDIVILLAVLHKLKDPTGACKRLAEAARELVVIRMPSRARWIIEDERSENTPHDIEVAMTEAGWRLDEEVTGPFNEPTGYFVRG